MPKLKPSTAIHGTISTEVKEDKIKKSIGTFFSDVFDRRKPFTKSDLDMISSIYKSLDKNMTI